MAIIGIHGSIGAGKDTVGKMLQYLSSDKNCSFNSYLNDKNYWLLHVRSEWHIQKFADKLKDMLCVLLGISRNTLEDREFKEKPLEGWDRWHLQELWINSEDAELITDLYFNTEAELDEYVVEFNHSYNTHTKVGLVSLTPRILMQSLGTEWGRKMIHPDLWVNALFNHYENAGHDVNHCSGGVERHKTCLPKWIIPDVRFPNEAQAIKDRDGIIINVIRPDIVKTNHSSETSLDTWQFDHTIINDGTLENLFNKVKSLQLV